MTLQEVMTELESKQDANTKRTLMKHGAKEPFFGVKVGDLKPLQKKIKKDYELSRQLYDTGNSDAMYLAGLIADETKMTKEDLQNWVENAYWSYLSEYAVPWVAAESDYGLELAKEWIASEEETIASAGWATLTSLVTIKNDEDLDLKTLEDFMLVAQNEVHTAQNRVKYTMNGFIIAVGSCVVPLSEKAKEIAEFIGKVSVEMNGTACKVPLATDYIKKVVDKGRLGKKKKTARC